LTLAMIAAIGMTGVASAQKDKDKKADAGAVFELYKDQGDKFRFRLKDGDGDLLAISGKGYETKADCQKIIDAIKSQAAKAKVEDDTKK
jgi:uncharacterized protein YegP (UPF0339 family)